MARPRVVAAPASLKGVLSAPEAAGALAAGLREGGAEALELPVADGGEGTATVLAAALGGEWREAAVADPLGRPVRARWLLLPDGRAVVEAAAAIGLGLVAPGERDPLRASSRGLGELVNAALASGPSALVVCLGGSATVDGGVGFLDAVSALPVPTTALCDVRSPLLGPRGAAQAFGPQKGAGPADVAELERRLAADARLRPYATVPGAGAAGGLGAALASLGAELVRGAEVVLELAGLRLALAGAALVVSGEGAVDRTTWEGKAPAAVLAACREAGVPCVLFGGRVSEVPAATPVRELPGGPDRAAEDLRELGLALAAELDAR